jgi:hypothetical protein
LFDPHDMHLLAVRVHRSDIINQPCLFYPNDMHLFSIPEHNTFDDIGSCMRRTNCLHSWQLRIYSAIPYLQSTVYGMRWRDAVPGQIRPSFLHECHRLFGHPVHNCCPLSLIKSYVRFSDTVLLVSVRKHCSNPNLRPRLLISDNMSTHRVRIKGPLLFF